MKEGRMNPWDFAREQLNSAAEKINLEPGVHKRLRQSRKELTALVKTYYGRGEGKQEEK